MPTRADICQFAELGIKLLINNNPEGDQAGQMSSREMADIAQELEIMYRHIPLPDGWINAEALASFMWLPKFEPAVACCSDPEDAYCLWAAEQVLISGRDILTLTEAAKGIGFNLARLPSIVEHLRNA